MKRQCTSLFGEGILVSGRVPSEEVDRSVGEFESANLSSPILRQNEKMEVKLHMDDKAVPATN